MSSTIRRLLNHALTGALPVDLSRAFHAADLPQWKFSSLHDQKTLHLELDYFFPDLVQLTTDSHQDCLIRSSAFRDGQTTSHKPLENVPICCEVVCSGKFDCNSQPKRSSHLAFML